MYNFITKKDYKKYSKDLNNLIIELHQNLKNKYNIKFDHYLIGSAKSKLVMRNGKEPFDFDYCLEIKKYDNDDKKIRKIFFETIQEISKKYKFDSFGQGERSIKIKKHSNEIKNHIDFYAEFAILKKINGKINILKWKDHNCYIWNNEVDLNDLWKRFNIIRKKSWNEFKERYKDKKNKYLNDKTKKSIYIFSETINEFEER